MNGVRVLVVGPHPDDAEFGAGGWLARLASAQARTCIATFPPVDAAGADEPNAPQRMGEAAKAAALLGAEFRALPRTAPQDAAGLAQALRTLLTDVAPDVLVTVDERDSHPWHQAVSRAVTAAAFAVQAIGSAPPPQLLYMAGYTSIDFISDIYVDVTAYYPKALQALRCHTTGLAVTPMLPYQMRLVHQLAGCRAAVELAEGFRLSHDFGQDWCARRSVLYRLLGG